MMILVKPDISVTRGNLIPGFRKFLLNQDFIYRVNMLVLICKIIIVQHHEIDYLFKLLPNRFHPSMGPIKSDIYSGNYFHDTKLSNCFSSQVKFA